MHEVHVNEGERWRRNQAIDVVLNDPDKQAKDLEQKNQKLIGKLENKGLFTS